MTSQRMPARLLCVCMLTCASSSLAQTSDGANRAQCEDLRMRATALHQERADISSTEDFLALAVGMETLDAALDEIARDYARLRCGQAGSSAASND